MFTNYVKTAFRFFKENKVFTTINITGLILALSSSFLMLLYVTNELSYDSSFKNRRRIYRVINYSDDFKKTFAYTPYALANKCKEEIPQIEMAINIRPQVLLIKVGNSTLVSKAICTESDVVDLFPLKMIWRLKEKDLLQEKNSILISKSLSEKIFSNQNPVGKEFYAGVGSNKIDVFVVTGVYDDNPVNTTFNPECLINSQWQLEQVNSVFKVSNSNVSWDKDFWTTYLLLSKGASSKLVEEQFSQIESKYLPSWLKNHYKLQNLSDVYLRSAEIENSGLKGDINNVRFYLAIAFLIVLVAVINYIVLSLAMSSKRIKEIGIRKTFGASIDKIRSQILTESSVLALIAMPFAILVLLIILPYSINIFHIKVKILSTNILIYCLVSFSLAFLIGIGSGLYTSTYLSKLSVLEILRNSMYSGRKRPVFRSYLIILQIILFSSFFSSILIIKSQYNFAVNKDLGFYNKNVLFFDIPSKDRHYVSLLNSLKSMPYIISASGVLDGLPMKDSMSSIYKNFQDNGVKVEVESLTTDYNFFETMGIKIADGRDFSKEFGTDLMQSVILNETAVKSLGIVNPIGKKMGNKTIIGVVKDFNLHSIHTKIPPLQIYLSDDLITQIVIHYKDGTLDALIPAIKSEWQKNYHIAFNYTTIDKTIENLYGPEKNMGIIVLIFTILILFITSLGLFGITLFTIKARIREFGIRKVFGSSEKSIIFINLKRYFILALFASIISLPVTIYVMGKWLENFAYKTNIRWEIFVVSFVVSTSIIISTVITFSVKLSHFSVVEALKND
jgi:putative ABC transport system permease protein